MVSAVQAIAACAPLLPTASISACKPAPPEGSKPEKHSTVGRTHISLIASIYVSIGNFGVTLDSHLGT